MLNLYCNAVSLTTYCKSRVDHICQKYLDFDSTYLISLYYTRKDTKKTGQSKLIYGSLKPGKNGTKTGRKWPKKLTGKLIFASAF